MDSILYYLSPLCVGLLLVLNTTESRYFYETDAVLYGHKITTNFKLGTDLEEMYTSYARYVCNVIPALFYLSKHTYGIKAK